MRLLHDAGSPKAYTLLLQSVMRTLAHVAKRKLTITLTLYARPHPVPLIQQDFEASNTMLILYSPHACRARTARQVWPMFPWSSQSLCNMLITKVHLTFRSTLLQAAGVIPWACKPTNTMYTCQALNSPVLLYQSVTAAATQAFPQSTAQQISQPWSP